MALRFDDFDILMFDCYGTLIDWESGLLFALKPVLSKHGVQVADGPLLEAYAELETRYEAGPYQPYKSVLRCVLSGLGSQFGFTPSEEELALFSHSVRNWPPFDDSAAALQVLESRYKLVVLSNIDDDLFSHSANHLQVEFDRVFTAQQIGSYKPSFRNFEYALERLDTPPKRILHIAQSLFHDIKPAQALGLSTVWVNRRQGREGFGATPPADTEPDYEVPDLRSLEAAMFR
ncbi:MAG: haloacid dehalogenase type II [bacterium]